jgi:flagellar protein FlbD
MIRLTRLRQNTPFILNPDHIERVDTHVDTVVRLTTGAEYVVNETGEDIVRMTIDYRAHVLAAAGQMAITRPEPDEVTPPAPEPDGVATVGVAAEPSADEVTP